MRMLAVENHVGVSQLERGEVATIDAIARYIEALGGRLGRVASFGDHVGFPLKRQTGASGAERVVSVRMVARL